MTVFVILKQTLFYPVVKLWQPIIHDWFSDTRQVLKWCLGSTAVGAQYGAVSALSFNRDCSRLLCGFAKGQVSKNFAITGINFCIFDHTLLSAFLPFVIFFVILCVYVWMFVCLSLDHHVGFDKWQVDQNHHWCSSTWNCGASCQSN